MLPDLRLQYYIMQAQAYNGRETHLLVSSMLMDTSAPDSCTTGAGWASLAAALIGGEDCRSGSRSMLLRSAGAPEAGRALVSLTLLVTLSLSASGERSCCLSLSLPLFLCLSGLLSRL